MKMITIFSSIAMLLFTTPAQGNDERAITYDEIMGQAINNCPHAREVNIKPAILWQLVKIEQEAGVPARLRGMILAAACKESGYNPNAEGDHKFSKNKKTPMAIGILQMWRIYEKMYPGLDRTNPKEAAKAWMNHIVKKIPKVKRQCKYRKEEKIWVAAWVTGIRSKKVGGRCKERPTHLRLLKKWHKNIKKERTSDERGYMERVPTIKKGDGC